MYEIAAPEARENQGGTVSLNLRFAAILSLAFCALFFCTVASGQQQRRLGARKTRPDEDRWTALNETIAAQQKQIDELKATVQKLIEAIQHNSDAGQRAADHAQQTAQEAQAAAETSQSDARLVASAAAQASAAATRDHAALAAGIDSVSKSFSDRLKNLGPLSFSGDLRLRDEPFFGGPADQSQVRNRMRYRLRVNANAKLSDEFSGGFTLETGDINNPVSVMQTANQQGTRKPFYLGRAFMEYRPRFYKPLMLTGGKISQPWVATELVWDKDLDPEGLAQTLTFHLERAPVLKRVALVGFELPFAETAGVSLNDKSIVQSAVYGAQLQTEWQLAPSIRFSVSTAFYNWQNSDPIALAIATANAASPDFGLLRLNSNGNQNSVVTTTGTFVATGQKTVTNAQFASKFGLLDTIARFDFSTPAPAWPIAILGDFVQNTKACANAGNILPAPANTPLQTFSQSTNAACDSHQRRGYWLEARAGRAQKKGDIDLAYARIFVEREAVLGAFNYSEMRQATNVSEHKIEATYQLENNIQFGFTGFFGRPLVTATSPLLENTLKRLQFDVTYKF